MNARDLFDAEGKLVNVAQCGKCGRLWDLGFAPIGSGGVDSFGNSVDRWTPERRYEYVRWQAERCCNWRCERCGKPAFAEFQNVCREHLDEAHAQQEAAKESERFAKASPTTDDVAVMHGERVYENIEEYLEYEGFADDAPEYLWVALPEPMHIDAEHVVENATCELHEYAQEEVTASAVKELQALLDAWCGKFAVRSYVPDYTRYVLVPQEEAR